MRRWLLAFALVACKRTPSVPEVQLRLLRDGAPLAEVSLPSLAERVAQVRTDDPYYGKSKTFFAVPLAAVLERFGADADRTYVLRAKDGYSVPFEPARLHEAGAWLAFADAEVAGYEPIGAQQTNPFPLYLIWSEPGQGDLETHPRPWQLESIDLTRFELAYPHTAPPAQEDAAADARAAQGYAGFRSACFKCHAINREGGRVGPELNVPQNVFEYLHADYIRSFVRDPAQYRYSVMPSHTSMPDEELDAILFYVRSMRARKHVP